MEICGGLIGALDSDWSKCIEIQNSCDFAKKMSKIYVVFGGQLMGTGIEKVTNFTSFEVDSQ